MDNRTRIRRPGGAAAQRAAAQAGLGLSPGGPGPAPRPAAPWRTLPLAVVVSAAMAMARPGAVGLGPALVLDTVAGLAYALSVRVGDGPLLSRARWGQAALPLAVLLVGAVGLPELAGWALLGSGAGAMAAALTVLPWLEGRLLRRPSPRLATLLALGGIVVVAAASLAATAPGVAAPARVAVAGVAGCAAALRLGVIGGGPTTWLVLRAGLLGLVAAGVVVPLVRAAGAGPAAATALLLGWYGLTGVLAGTPIAVPSGQLPAGARSGPLLRGGYGLFVVLAAVVTALAAAH